MALVGGALRGGRVAIHSERDYVRDTAGKFSSIGSVRSAQMNTRFISGRTGPRNRKQDAKDVRDFRSRQRGKGNSPRRHLQSMREFQGALNS